MTASRGIRLLHLALISRRRDRVAALRAEGYSVRGIAGIVNVDPHTVRNDLAALGAPLPITVHGLDGKQYAMPRGEA